VEGQMFSAFLRSGVGEEGWLQLTKRGQTGPKTLNTGQVQGRGSAGRCESGFV
jgi:hypothetical protein